LWRLPRFVAAFNGGTAILVSIMASKYVRESVLRSTALESGLLSHQQLEDALAGLRQTSEGSLRTLEEIRDADLGERLIELGYLNRWQVEQLKEGRTRFTLGPYRIVDAIGKGGMGHVFKAEHELLGRVEAIKVLPKHKSTPQAIASFQREIRAQAQLDHPNLVRVSYADRDGDTYFFVTEYVPGTDLRKLVRRNGALSVSIAATIVAQAAEGLHYAHRKGLVHRDVKPGNLLVTPDGRTKVTDLGLAWYLMEDLGATDLRKSNVVVGTADYLAPEVIREPQKVRPVSDVYALGCTLYYAVTGKVPFPGGNTPDKMRRHLEETPLNPLHFNPDLPKEFCDLIAAMMDKNPDSRVPTAAAAVEQLLRWCDPHSTHHVADLASLGERVATSGAADVASHGLAETSSFSDIHDFDAGPPVESPSQLSQLSQVSQGTVPIAADLQDTLPTVVTRPMPVQEAGTGKGKWWVWIGLAIGLVCVGVAAVLLWKML
jgi:serine/threonine protein kinase